MKSRTLEALSWSNRHYQKYMLRIFLMVAISVVVSYLDTLESLYTGRIVDSLVATDRNQFISNLLLIAIILSSSFTISLISSWYVFALTRKVTISDEMQLYDKIINSKE